MVSIQSLVRPQQSILVYNNGTFGPPECLHIENMNKEICFSHFLCVKQASTMARRVHRLHQQVFLNSYIFLGPVRDSRTPSEERILCASAVLRFGSLYCPVGCIYCLLVINLTLSISTVARGARQTPAVIMFGRKLLCLNNETKEEVGHTGRQ